jgi:hypothetical protein
VGAGCSRNPAAKRSIFSHQQYFEMQPPQDDGPVNSLSKIYVEIDGKHSADWTRQFTYKELGH